MFCRSPVEGGLLNFPIPRIEARLSLGGKPANDVCTLEAAAVPTISDARSKSLPDLEMALEVTRINNATSPNESAHQLSLYDFDQQ